MHLRRLAVLVGGLIAWAGLTFAQENNQEVPQIDEPRKPTPEEQTGLLKGNKPFSLTTDPDGEFVYKFNEDNELESLEAKKGVVFTSEDMTLNADRLDYKAIKGELTATGKRVVVRQGDLIITCKLFKYYPERQHSEFIGNAVVYNRSKDGKTQTTAADKIIVDIVDGKAQMKVQGGGRVRPKMSQAATVPAVVATPGSGGARAMSVESQPSQAPNKVGEEVGASTPLLPSENESTGAAKVKLAPVSALSMSPEAGKQQPHRESNAPIRPINPRDPSQMESLAKSGEKK